MNFQNRIAVIFDLDGVITDTSIFHLDAWNELAKSMGIALNSSILESLKGIERMKSLEMILAFGNKELSDSEKAKLAEKKNQAYLKNVDKISPKNLLPGIKELLDYLQYIEVKTALASSSKNAPLVLDKLSIRPYFEYVVDPASLAFGKPHPEIFLKAAKGINISPEYCIGIEDAAAGVESINAAGMFSVGIGSEEALSNADLVISDITKLDLEGLLNRFNI